MEINAGREAMVADPEVSERPKRRRFTAEYKLRIVREADACKGDGDIVALLGREGLYSSQLSAWRRQRDEIAKAGLALRKRGRKAKAEDPKLKELERENARLKRRLARVETMLEIQKKPPSFWGSPIGPSSLVQSHGPYSPIGVGFSKALRTSIFLRARGQSDDRCRCLNTWTFLIRLDRHKMLFSLHRACSRNSLTLKVRILNRLIP